MPKPIDPTPAAPRSRSARATAPDFSSAPSASSAPPSSGWSRRSSPRASTRRDDRRVRLVFAPVAALNLLSSIKEQKALIKEITGLPPRHPRVTQLFAVVFGFSWALTVGRRDRRRGDLLVCVPRTASRPRAPAAGLRQHRRLLPLSNTNWNLDAVFSAFVAGRQLFWVRLHETIAVIVIAVVARHRLALGLGAGHRDDRRRHSPRSFIAP